MKRISDINPTKQRAFVVTRRAPKQWRDVFQNLSRIHEINFTTNDVRHQHEKLGIRIKPNSLQVKLARYVAKGYLSKPHRNQFRISSKGLKFFDVLTSTKEDEIYD